jgi:RNA polymerase primary sigma factor
VSVAELQELEEVKGLITRGQQVGVLTYAEIATGAAAKRVVAAQRLSAT